MNSARLFEGVAMQSLLGAYYASVLRPPGACHQVRLRELDGYHILDARLGGRVLVVIGATGGRYDRLVFRFAEDFADYDVRVARDVTSANINFTVLDGGVVLLLNDEDKLEVFSEERGSARLSLLADPSVRGDVRLFSAGPRALFARADKLYRLSLRRSSS
jgi:hypothetical protein